MIAREKFLKRVLELEGQPVVWGGLDCSETVALGVLAATDGKVDQRQTHRAQSYYEETRPLLPAERALPADLVFYGTIAANPCKEGNRIIHVAVILEGGKVLSADGATSRITDPVIAAQNPLAKVKIHESVHFRRDLFVTIHRFVRLDSLDNVVR